MAKKVKKPPTDSVECRGELLSKNGCKKSWWVEILILLISILVWLVVSNIFGIFIPNFGEMESNLTSTYFFRWVGSTTNQLCKHCWSTNVLIRTWKIRSYPRLGVTILDSDSRILWLQRSSLLRLEATDKAPWKKGGFLKKGLVFENGCFGCALFGHQCHVSSDQNPG